MKVLVLGGSRFLGRNVVDSALGRGHEVTVFNRGRNNGDMPDSVEILVGNRDGGLDALLGRSWNAIIDTSGYVPRVVRETGEVLANAKTHYVFVSSLSVYTTFAKDGLDESAEVGTLEDPSVETVDGVTYGPLKVLCEQAVSELFPSRWASVRAGLIVGPRDDIGRFPWWLRRIERGGRVLAPGRPERHLQLVDARDLGDWMVLMAEEGTTGVYNATGPESPTTMREFLETATKVTKSDAELVWASDEFLADNDVAPWSEMPLYLPESGDTQHFSDVDVSKAVAAGLRFRPLAETIRDTLDWTQPPAPRDSTLAGQPGIDPEKEAALLEKLSK